MAGWSLLGAMTLFTGCASLTEHRVGLVDGDLTPCPDAPRCVSSRADEPDRRVDPFELAEDMDPDTAWAEARDAVASMPRTTLVDRRPDYLRAEVISPWHVYTDDLELLLDRQARLIHVRSSARIGYYDFGVNRERVEALRGRLLKRGLLESR
ncbi:hypothetical protein PC39_00580 [Salinisphaera sp. PC39]